jgi:hypothetical protein
LRAFTFIFLPNKETALVEKEFYCNFPNRVVTVMNMKTVGYTVRTVFCVKQSYFSTARILPKKALNVPYCLPLIVVSNFAKQSIFCVSFTIWQPGPPRGLCPFGIPLQHSLYVPVGWLRNLATKFSAKLRYHHF